MKWRRISPDQVKSTLLDAEKIEESIEGRKNAFKHIGKKWLKVTFKEENDIIYIITAIDEKS